MKISKIKTLPPESRFHFCLRFLLRPIMLLFANAKISHWWNWENLDTNKIKKGVLIEGDKNAPPRSQNNKLSLIKSSLGGWKTCVIVEPENDSVEKWFLAFQSTEKNETVLQRCNIVLSGQVRVLVGPNQTTFVGLTEHGHIKLKFIARTTRDDKRYKHIPLI